MKRLGIAGLAGLLAVLPAAGQVQTFAIDRMQQHASWYSAIVKRPGGPVARAGVKVSNGNALVFDFPAGQCGRIPHAAVYVQMDAEIEQPSSRDVAGSFRVDQRELFAFAGTYSSHMGDAVSMISIQFVRDPDDFILQVLDGRTLRLQLGDINSQTTERFPLSGVASAYYRARHLCREELR